MGGAQCKCISRHSYKSELSIWSLAPCSNCNPLILPLTRVFRLGGIAPLHIRGAAGFIPVAWEEWTGSIAAGRDLMPPALGGCYWYCWSLNHFTMPGCSLACGGHPHQPQRNGSERPSAGCGCRGCSTGTQIFPLLIPHSPRLCCGLVSSSSQPIL